MGLDLSAAARAVLAMAATIAIAVAAPARASTAYRTGGAFDAVAADGSADAWAVGYSNNFLPLIAHWNGIGWTNTPVPAPHGVRPGVDVSELTGVAATAPDNAWAVERNSTGARFESAILHWNGAGWTQSSLNPGDYLQAAAATSASNAWVVGSDPRRVLILHWNGRRWSRSSAPKIGGTLESVTVTSARNAWAVGFVGSPGGAGVPSTNQPLIMHWNGTTWRRAATHLPSNLGNLRSVAATSADNAWAVGCWGCLAEGAGQPLTEHWNGRSWTRVRAPGLSSLAGLWGVAAVSGADAWVTGPPGQGGNGVGQWNGRSWRTVQAPDPGGDRAENAVAASSATDVWVVGADTTETSRRVSSTTVILHWDGSAWN